MSSIQRMAVIGMMFLISNTRANINIVNTDSIQYTPQQVETVMFLNSAITYYQKNGLEKSIKEFSEGDMFKKDNHYIFIINKAGSVVAHGFNLVPKDNLSKVKTMSGESLKNVLYALGNNSNGGWYTIIWASPQKNRRSLKTLYVKKLPCSQPKCKDMVIGTGHY
ncbi:MAG: cache domain-containing protein [Gammaproteobacteria bacterium]|nr:cache domain-containing protein [Gammaproteobacteria bacterium]